MLTNPIQFLIIQPIGSMWVVRDKKGIIYGCKGVDPKLQALKFARKYLPKILRSQSNDVPS